MIWMILKLEKDRKRGKSRIGNRATILLPFEEFWFNKNRAKIFHNQDTILEERQFEIW